MSDAGELARAEVRLHEMGAHTPMEERLAGLIALIDAACAEAAEVRDQLTEHLATYHAPEPEPEPEPAPEPAPEPEPEPEPEPAPGPDEPPAVDSRLFRRLGGNKDA